MIINMGNSEKFVVEPICGDKYGDKPLTLFVAVDLCWMGAPDQVFYFRIWAVNETDAEQFACGEKPAWEVGLTRMLVKAEKYWCENDMDVVYGAFPKEQFERVARDFFKNIRNTNGHFVAYSDKVQEQQEPEVESLSYTILE